MKKYGNKKGVKKENIEYEETAKRGTSVAFLIVLCFIVVVGILLLKTYVMTSYMVDGESMTPTLQSNQTVWVSKTRPIDRGDIVVAQSSQLDKKLIKRVVAVAGDEILLIAGESGYLLQITTAEGETFTEDYEFYQPIEISEERKGCLSTTTPYVVEHYFLMGDNRNDSNDSRFLGEFTAEEIIGEVMNNDI